MSFQALGKFRIPIPHPSPPCSSASPTRVWAEEQRSASPDPTEISTPLHSTLQCLSCVNRRLGHRLNDLWKGNWDSPCLFISVYLPPKILPHFVPESLCLCFPCSRGSEVRSCSLVPSTAALVPRWGGLSRESGPPLTHQPLNSSACRLCPT